MRELFINNQSIDLYPNEHIALTKQCNKLNELKDRQADYSNQFVIPPTANNKRVCGFPNVVATDSINPYTKLPATYVENGSELIPNGVAIIEEYNGNINVTLYSGIFDFFNTLGDSSLRQLDLSDSDHIFNLASVAAGNTSDKYVYPLIQWGATGTTTKSIDKVDIRYQMPALRMPYIIDKIFEASQYQKGGDVFDFESYEKLILPVVEDELIDEDAVLLSESFKGHVQARTANGQGLTTMPIYFFGSGDAFDSTAGWVHSIPGTFIKRYVAGNKVTVNIRFRLFYTFTNDGAAPSGFTMRVFKNANNNDNGGSPTGIALNPTIIYSGTGTLDVIVENVNLNPGDNLCLRAGIGTGALNIYPTGALQGDPLEYSYYSVTAVNTRELNQNLSLTN